MNVSIVGCGPSLLTLTPEDVPAGPVIVLNHAILAVRKLGLFNPVYSMQKDGCQIHGCDAEIPLACVCPSPEMVQPVLPETLLLSTAESSGCFPDYPLRAVIDVEELLGVPWHTSSLPVAVLFALQMGATTLTMLACDAVHGDYRRFDGEGTNGYAISIAAAQHLAQEAGLPVVWC